MLPCRRTPHLAADRRAPGASSQKGRDITLLDAASCASVALARLAQVLGAPVGDPSTTRACQAALGGDYQVIRVGVERFGDQALGDLGTVGVGGVDEVHSMLYGPPEHAASFLRVLGFTHDTLPRQAHGAEAQAIDEEVAA